MTRDKILGVALAQMSKSFDQHSEDELERFARTIAAIERDECAGRAWQALVNIDADWMIRQLVVSAIKDEK